MPRDPQLNVRLTEAQRDAIQAAVFVRDLRSPQPLLDPLLEQLAAALMDDPVVAAAVALRKNAKSAAVVRPLPKSKQKGSSTS